MKDICTTEILENNEEKVLIYIKEYLNDIHKGIEITNRVIKDLFLNAVICDGLFCDSFPEYTQELYMAIRLYAAKKLGYTRVTCGSLLCGWLIIGERSTLQ